MTNTAPRRSFPSLAPTVPMARDSGIVDLDFLGGGGPISLIPFAPTPGANPSPIGLPSPLQLALGLVALAAIAAAGIVGRANYLVRQDVGTAAMMAPLAPLAKMAKPALPMEPTPVVVTELVPVAPPATSAPPAEAAPVATRPRATTTTRPRVTAPATPVATAPADTSPKSLEDLMASASTPREATPTAPTAPTAPALPVTPARAEVSRALTAFNSAVQTCGATVDGTAMVRFTFEGATGRARTAQVTGDFASSPTGACVERAVAGAKVPAFSQSTFVVSFPYRV